MRSPRFLILWCLLGSLTVAAQSVPQTVAEVNGQAITAEDLGRVADGRIRQLTESPEPNQSEAGLERAKLAIRWDALNYLIDRRLARAEAERRMISEDDLIKTEIEKQIEQPSRETIEAFTEANRDRMPMIKGLSQFEVFSQVGAFLVVQADRVRRAAYFKELAKQYGVRTYLEPLRADVATEGHAMRGDERSPVTIVEFSNFECPDCAAVAHMLDDVRTKNSDRVRIVYRHFPEAHHYPHAEQAAEAALCAHKQQRFWEFHDELFASPNELNDADLRKRAATLGVDSAAFGACMDSGAALREVGKDIDEAYSLGVMAAPTVFINGRMIVGKYDAREIQQLVDEELKRMGD